MNSYYSAVILVLAFVMLINCKILGTFTTESLKRDRGLNTGIPKYVYGDPTQYLQTIHIIYHQYDFCFFICDTQFCVGW